ncbi:MAG TPA: helicase-related protein [Thermodesulfovibrionales bacterium]|nr:helicase-related protein [Thermodesulfovibrionales bacterium]
MSNYSVGSIVNFRGREWVVLPSEEQDVLSLRPLTGSEQDACGIYMPIETNNIRPASFPLPSVEDLGDFESARLLRNAARLLLRYGAGPFRCMGHLSIYPRPYQLVPLLMALRLDPIRMLIADDVGIGKTIESALIARELMDRGEIRRIAVICPPYLCDQWQRELSEKFNIDAKIISTRTLASLERNLPRPNLSVFQYYPHIIVSVDFVKSQRRRDSFLLHCPDFVIVDEAHGCARPAGQSVAQQQRHQLIADLSKNPERHLILVTATPHSGIEESFMSLLGFLKPTFEVLYLENLKEAQRAELAHHLIQRRRADVKQWMGTETIFPERESKEEAYKLSPDYGKLFKDVYGFARELVSSGESLTGFRRRVRYWAAIALLRCVMSSPAAATSSLMARIDRLTEGESPEEVDYSPYIFDPTDVETVEDIVPTHVVNQGEKCFSDSERKKLYGFIRGAESLRGSKDTKMEKAEQEIKDLLREGYAPIVFCRFIPTAHYVAEELNKRLNKSGNNIHVIAVTGEDSEDEREIRIADLCKSSRRILVATDCLSEGINLQEGFNAVLHYDLPWNPNRLEQREGRVDRFGQIAPIVKTILLYGADNPIDGAVLEVLLRKAKKIHQSLGITVPLPVDSESVMETVLNALFLRGGDTIQMGLFDNEAPIVDVHQKWERAAEKEKKSRTRFAQHAIKPDEVAQELKVTDAVLGNAKVVEQFISTSCQRLGSPISRAPKHFKVEIAGLPQTIQDKLKDNPITKVKFDQPADEGVTYISRNHPLSITLAEYLFNVAMQDHGNRSVAARSGIIRSGNVNNVTVLLLLRLRFLIKSDKSEISSFAEECIISGYKGIGDSTEWLDLQEAEDLFEKASPSGNLSDADKKHWLTVALKDLDRVKTGLDSLAYERAGALKESYERLRKTIKGRQTTVEPLLPLDVLTMSVVVPQPKN